MLKQKNHTQDGPTAVEKRTLADLLRNKNFDQAIKYTYELLESYPKHPMLLQSGSMIHYLKGDKQTAASIMQEVVTHMPDNVEAIERLANYQMELETYEDALENWQKILKLAPDHLNALCAAGSAFNMLELYHRAADQFEKAVTLAPDNHEIIEVLANTYLESRQYDRAVQYYKTLIEQKPDHLQIKTNLADALSHIDKIDEALTLCDEILSVQADLVNAHILKGNLYAMIGDKKNAQASLTKALKLEPESLSALNALVQRTKITKSNCEKYVPTLEKIFAEKDLPPKAKSIAGFALGKAAHDLKDTQKAFSYWEKANMLQLEDQPYDEDKALKRFEILKHIFAPVNFNNLNPAEAHPKPQPGDKQMIFIIGMPRSGTSLAEQIISSHSAVYGAGELNVMSQVTEELLFHFTQEPEVKLIDRAFGSIGRDYMDAIVAMDIDQPYVIDKLPHNFLRLGFIRAAFPNAKIIHTNRDPMAVCWSNYRRHFPAKGMNFGNAMDTLGTYYRHYEGLMDFWRHKFGATIYELDYDRLTHNQEPETRALLEFCGLGFEANCLDFHKTSRPVRTASQEQVRQKMYTGSTKEWEAYENHLKPLKKALHLDN